MAPPDGNRRRPAPTEANAPLPTRRSLRESGSSSRSGALTSEPTVLPPSTVIEPRPASLIDPHPSAGARTRRDLRAGLRPTAPAEARRSARRGTGRLAGVLDRRRNRRTLTVGQKIFGMMTVAGMVFTGAVVAAGTSSAEVAYTRAGFAPTGTWAWYNDTVLGKTASTDQYAQAQVNGLLDGDHNAGFFMRYTNKSSRVLVAVTGTGWKIEPQGGRILTGTFAHGSAGLFRTELQGQTVRVLWNGVLVTSQKIDKVLGGKNVLPTVWQSTPTVKLSALEASSLAAPGDLAAPPTTSRTTSSTTTGATTTGTTSSTGPATSTTTSSSPATTPDGANVPLGQGTWLSGAGADNMANGGFDRWRFAPAGIAATWDDANSGVQQELYSICGGQYSSGRWDRALDMAIGAIFTNEGESWSAAANGAYNDRWRKVLTKAKSCWGGRDPGKLFLRFGHEMNLDSSDWAVHAGQEGDYARAFTQFSNVRYDVFPGVQLVLSVNDGSSGGMADVRKLFPGKDSQGRPTVNVYSVDSYNMWPHCTTSSGCEQKFDASENNGAPLGIEKHRQLAEQLGLPIAISEWSNNGNPGDADGGGESPEYMRSFYAWAKGHSGDPNHPRPGQVLYDCLFNLWSQYQLSPNTMQPQTAETYQHLKWGA